MKIGVYVGSFNPVHKGHINIVNYLIAKEYVDKIIIVPTESYWNKKDLVSIDHRINMLKLYETNNILIDTKLNKYQYTYQVLSEIKKEHQNIHLIIGSDNIPKFHLWKNVEEILENKIIVINRNNLDIRSDLAKFKSNNFILIPNYPQVDISSTKIRQLIAKERIEDLNKYLDQEVIKYILNKNLYKGEKNENN